MNRQKDITTFVSTVQDHNRQYDAIQVSIDWHAAHYRVVRIIDNGGPQPAQRFRPEDFVLWMKKQRTLARKVYSCYEAGAGGFVLHRQLTELGVTNYVVAPRKLDRNRKGVVTDKTDARELALNLNRYVAGNKRAMQVVQSGNWWTKRAWTHLQRQLAPWLVERLGRLQKVLVVVNEQLKEVTAKVKMAAPKDLPMGFGALTFETARREVCDWGRFANRRGVGGYTGLVGGVSSSGDYYCELAITKAGNVRLRPLAIELAWRMVFFQSQSKLIQKWKHILRNSKAPRRARKRAIVAVARQLMVDLWRWQSGKVTPEQLGWRMKSSAGVRDYVVQQE